MAVATYTSSCISAVRDTPADLEITVEALLTQVSSQSTQIAEQMEFISYLATRTPPLRSSPAARPIPTPFVTGSLFINDGKCCMGGIAGNPMVIPVEFQAVSPAAEVTDMRSRAGSASFGEADLSDAEWELFYPRRVFEYTPPLNLSGFYVTVQFRYTLGNVSPVYSSEISVEGIPTAPMTIRLHDSIVT